MAQTSVKLQIPSELFAVAESSRFEGEIDVSSLDVGPDEYRFEKPVAWSVEITNTGSAFLVAGKATGEATCACSRCLDDFSYAFDGDIEGYFLLSEEDADEFEDDEIGEDEFSELPADHVIDLFPLIQAALMVNAPTMPLCREDCAGLCSQCGANLNDGPCGCGEDESLADFERTKNPFAALANYEFD